MRPSKPFSSNTNFISGENIISEMGQQSPGFNTGSSVINEMRPMFSPRPTRPSYITGSNIINEMKPRPTRPMFSPTPSPETTAKPSITFVQTTRLICLHKASYRHSDLQFQYYRGVPILYTYYQVSNIQTYNSKASCCDRFTK